MQPTPIGETLNSVVPNLRYSIRCSLSFLLAGYGEPQQRSSTTNGEELERIIRGFPFMMSPSKHSQPLFRDPPEMVLCCAGLRVKRLKGISALFESVHAGRQEFV